MHYFTVQIYRWGLFFSFLLSSVLSYLFQKKERKKTPPSRDCASRCVPDHINMVAYIAAGRKFFDLNRGISRVFFFAGANLKSKDSTQSHNFEFLTALRFQLVI